MIIRMILFIFLFTNTLYAGELTPISFFGEKPPIEKKLEKRKQTKQQKEPSGKFIDKKSASLPTKKEIDGFEKIIKSEHYEFTPAELWGTPTIDSDGKISYKLPYKPVLEFALNPTVENAEKYLEWNMERISTIQQMTQSLKEAVKRKGLKLEAPILEKEIESLKKQIQRNRQLYDTERFTSAEAVTILYFYKTGCPACEAMIPQINKLNQLTDAKIIGISIDKPFNKPKNLHINAKPDTGETDKFGITKCPVVVILKNGKYVMLKGFNDYRVIKAMLKTL